MKIIRLSLWQVPITSHEKYIMAEGKVADTVTTSVLRIDTDAGISGWGETCPIPNYLPAYADGVPPAIEYLAEVLLGSDPIGPEALMAKCDTHLIGHGYAKSAIDAALWDILGKAADQPVYTLLGGAQVDRLPLYHSITCIAPEEMARIAREAYAAGMRQFQVKLGADRNVEADIARLVQVREAVGPGPIVYGDWNCGANRLDAIRVGRGVAHLDVMLEQPCETIADCAAVRNATGLPLKYDEGVHDIASLLEAFGTGTLDAAALKLAKFGGLTRARRARDLCLHLGCKMVIEDPWGSDIAMVTALHLAATTPSRAVLNVCDLSGYAHPRLDPSAPTRNGAFIGLPSGPGLGIAPDMDVLGQEIAIFD